jgi:hypothetical protein
VTSEAIPRDAALRMQLAAIVGSEPESSFIEIRPLDRDGRPVVQRRTFVPVRAHTDAMERVAALAPMMNVYVGAAPRARQDGTAASVERVWSLWADLDGRDALKRLRDFHPLPALVIRSGSPDCAHGYWPLRQPLEPSWAQRANRRLALALGGDACATDPARILRAAGTLNLKHRPSRPVVSTRLNLESFTLDEVVGGLPDSGHYAPRRVTRVTSSDGSLGGVLTFVRSAAVGERNRALNWAAYRLGERADVDHEAVREELRQAGLDVGLSELEVERTISSGLSAGMRTAA